ncbi:5-dehydro-4-deoxyglucarate dehydratase [Desertivibrio insolitus]|uniref:5-dehydro-4-deoxyglucarate dehydratase n=1 Tax=Herbiconiux sp. SYSU D00978 TaxID=2812562 RepID=UPI001A96FD07|nr:5-dehydro-4-deoxyglucarate dehydratase [Herbiconiux sp. SYSU D00978]
MPDLRFADGVLFFPVTAFDADDRIDLEVLEQHIARGVDAGPGAVFAACGTGEYHALALEEYELAVRTAVTATAGRVPVVAGVGGPLGHARSCARLAADAGAEALLVMPPYLVQGPQAGLVAYVDAIIAASDLPVIVYHRGTAKFTTDSVVRLLERERVVGIKDGVGDVALAQEFVLAAERSGRGDILFFNGLLTAELSQAAYAAIGVPLYSSAVFAMAPDIATAFYRAYRAGDVSAQRRLLDGFYAPLVRQRDETPGFAVSLIKAGIRLSGLEVGAVRAPLVDPDERQLARLGDLLEQGRALLP